MCGLNDEKCWEWVEAQPDKSDPANNPYVAMVDEAQDDVGNLAINAGLVLMDIANVPSGESLAMIAAKGKVDDTLGIISGKAQQTTQGGVLTTHGSTSQRVAEDMESSGQYVRVHLNETIKKITGGDVPSRLRPDVAGVTPDGKVAVVEVLSPGQTRLAMEKKWDDALGDYCMSVECLDPD